MCHMEVIENTSSVNDFVHKHTDDCEEFFS